MNYRILLHPRANDFIISVQKDLENRIKKKIKTLSLSPEKGNKLKLSNFRRLRIGDYRAIYEIDHKKKQVIILFIGHRKDVYDDFSRLI